MDQLGSPEQKPISIKALKRQHSMQIAAVNEVKQERKKERDRQRKRRRGGGRGLMQKSRTCACVCVCVSGLVCVCGGEGGLGEGGEVKVLGQRSHS